MDERSDGELISSWLRDRNELAARALFDRWVPPVQKFCLAWCGGNTHDAEDLSQDVFVAAFDALHRFKGRSGFGTWLFAIAKRRAADHSRKAVRERKRLERSGRLEQAAADTGLGDPSLELVRAFEAESLWRDLALLSPQDRTMLVLFETEDVSIKELTDLFGLKAGTVKSRLSRARSLLLSRGTSEERGGIL